MRAQCVLRAGLLLGFAAAVPGCDGERERIPATPAPVLPCTEGVEGVYTSCAELLGSSETITLEDGRFVCRGWVSLGPKEFGPFEGNYSVEGDRIVLHHTGIRNHTRTFEVVNGVRVLWRDDGLKYWRKERRIWPYACLVNVQDATRKDASDYSTRAQIWEALRRDPSIECLLDEAMKERARREYEERFNDLPPSVRMLMRALTDKKEENYKKEIRKARANPDGELVKHLVSLLEIDESRRLFYRNLVGYGPSYANEAHSILKDLYSGERDPGERARELLVDALEQARNARALCVVLRRFLECSGIPGNAMTILEACVAKAQVPDGRELSVEFVYGYTGQVLRPKPSPDELARIIEACQQWCREDLAEAMPDAPGHDRPRRNRLPSAELE